MHKQARLHGEAGKEWKPLPLGTSSLVCVLAEAKAVICLRSHRGVVDFPSVPSTLLTKITLGNGSFPSRLAWTWEFTPPE